MRTRRRTVRTAALLAFAFCLVPLATASAATHIPPTSRVPAHGIMWGSTHVQQLEPLLGRKFALDHVYTSQWNRPFPTAYDYKSSRQGHTIIRNWKPWENGRPVTWARIASGAEDRIIRARADAVRRFGKTYYLVFHHEQDIHPAWGSPSDYRRAYRHIVTIFRQEHATNVVNVFVETSGGYRLHRAKQFYPGNKYVDVIGVDGYDWRGCASWARASRSFNSLFSPAERFAEAHNRPLFVVEYAADEIGSAPQHKRDWIERAAEVAQKMPNLRAMIWFDSSDQGCDWPVSSSERALSAYRQIGKRPYFQARAPRT